jgi:DNA polymerase-3 subunit alpha
MPPPPDTFPEDWGGTPAPAVDRTAAAPKQVSEKPVTVQPQKNKPEPAQADVIPVQEAASVIQEGVLELEPDGLEPVPVIISPEPETQAVQPPIQESAIQRPPQMVTVILRSSGDRMRDILHLRRIHGTLISFPGQDRFAFYMIEAGRSYVLEFPNFTTGVCDELLSRVRLLVGVDQVRLETLTFQ